MKIQAIAGSLRKESYNHQLALAAQDMVAELDPSIEFSILDWSEVPLFNQDIEFPPPASVTNARNAIKEADGLWIFTPEYNHALPGVLKNLLDWMSRPVSDTEGQVLAGKPVAFSGASIGQSGTSHAQDQLILLLIFLNMKVMSNPRFLLPFASKQTDETGKLELSTSASFLKAQAQAFIDFIK